MSYNDFIEKNFENILNDIGTLVKVNTVYDADTVSETAPLGQGIADGVDVLIKMAESMGMKCKNWDGYAIEITLGEGEKTVGILAHLDVVEASGDWNTPPFEPVVKDGKMFGRGTMDDKGPLVSCLYAMKYIEEKGLLPENTQIRLIVGCDEEEEYRCMEYYIPKSENLPVCSIVPDAYFPMINSEKGLVDFDMTYKLNINSGVQAEVIEFYGGNARNIVAADAKCKIKVNEENREFVFEKLQSIKDFTVEKTSDGFEISTKGVATHAMAPENGLNAISVLITGLKQSGIVFSIQEFIDTYDKLIGMDYNGKKLGCGWADEASGVLTFNVGIMQLEGEQISFKANVRYPISYNHDALEKEFFGALNEAGFKCKEILALDPLYVDENTDLVKKLMEIYQDVTGDMESKPIAIGGATYARYLPNAVSFGPLFPGEIELAHEANEYISLESLKNMTVLYIRALEEMVKM